MPEDTVHPLHIPFFAQVFRIDQILVLLHESQNVFTEKFRQFHVNFINLLVRRTNKFVENENENRKESLGYGPLRKGNP